MMKSDLVYLMCEASSGERCMLYDRGSISYSA